MSTHPNVILLCRLKPDDLSRKTLRSIRVEMGVGEDDDADFKIGEGSYHVQIMESDYDEDWQIGGDEGDILVFDLVTYGYGESITWDKLTAQKAELDEWAKKICEKFSCSYTVVVTANYW